MAARLTDSLQGSQQRGLPRHFCVNEGYGDQCDIVRVRSSVTYQLLIPVQQQWKPASLVEQKQRRNRCCRADLGQIVHALCEGDNQLLALDGWQAVGCLGRGAFTAPLTLKHG